MKTGVTENKMALPEVIFNRVQKRVDGWVLVCLFMVIVSVLLRSGEMGMTWAAAIVVIRAVGKDASDKR